MKKHTFILSDNSVNESGFRIATAGVELEKFKANPVMLYMHQRANWSNPKVLPIGRWENIRVEEGKILAEADFDEKDEFAMQIKSKVEGGYLNAASIAVRVTAVSAEEVDLLEGQTRPTVSESVAKEASIVDIPRNANCLMLTDEQGNYIDLSFKEGMDKLNNILPIISNKIEEMNKTVIAALELPEGATEADVIAAFQNAKNKVKQLSDEVKDLKTQIKKAEEDAKAEKANALVQNAIDAKKITEQDRETWLGLAAANYDNTKKALDKIGGYQSLSSQIQTGASDKKAKEKEMQNLSDVELFEAKYKAGELEDWKKENPEEFERCELAWEKDI